MLTRKELTAWTDALRANPEQQLTGRLTNCDNTRFCCLGKLCQVMGLVPTQVPIPFSESFNLGYGNQYSILPSEMEVFGDYRGEFCALHMPNLGEYHSAACANDDGVSWLEIADHFDKYYPCSDDKQLEVGV